MEYKKIHKLYEEQADLLISRRLICDKNHLIHLLKGMNYYRLTGYLFPYKTENEIYENCCLSNVERIIAVDEELSQLIFKMIRYFEIGIKAKIIYKFTKNYGPFGYLDLNGLPCLSKEKHSKLLSDIETQTKKSKEQFVKHFQTKYGNCHKYLPLWMVSEIMTFGMIFTLYKGMEKKERAEIASEFFTHENLLESWLLSTLEIRNIVAHHGRIWKREIGLKPKIPKKHKKWNTPEKISNKRIFGSLSVLYYLLSFFMDVSNYYDEIKDVFMHNQNLLDDYGFPENWEQSEIWKMK